MEIDKIIRKVGLFFKLTTNQCKLLPKPCKEMINKSKQ